MTIQELIKYYQDTLIIQYKELQKARATVGAFVAEVLADQILIAVRDGYDLDTAVGVQLNAIAAYRGASRFNYGLSIPRPSFSLADATESDAAAIALQGFALASQADSEITWYFQTIEAEAAPIYSLTDDELRRLIKLKIAIHKSFLSMADIDTILATFFDTRLRLEENGVMAIRYFYKISDPDTFPSIAINTNSLPRPAGVSVSYAGF